MFEVIESRMIVPNMHLLVLKSPDIAREMRPGQFVILRASEEGERIPLSVSDWDTETGEITIVFMNVGSSTDQLASLGAGSILPTVVGPLGNPTTIEKFGTVLLLGGCYGIGSIFPIARALKAAGNRVIAVAEARSSYLVYWEERLSEVSDHFFKITRDGTSGYRGHVGRLPEIINSLDEPVNRIIVNGCTYLLKKGSEVTEPLNIHQDHGQPEPDHDRWYGNVRCLPCHCRFPDEICVRGRARFRRPSGRLGGTPPETQDVHCRRGRPNEDEQVRGARSQP
jgi:ferredoxin--NADP+ reductase